MATARGSLDQLANDRPRFPEGLELVLIDDSDDEHTMQQLTSLKYNVRRLSSITAAVTALSHMSADLILADVSLVGDHAGEAAKELFTAARQIPVVLMGSKCSSAQIFCAVNHGAADFLEKPLSQLKLRNIWQHTVRMMMKSCKLKSAPPSPDATATVDELMAKHDAAAAVAAASASSLEQPCSMSASEEDGRASGLPGDVEVPDFMPPQFNMDADMLLLGLEAPVPPDEPSLDDILQPYAGTDSLSADQLSTDQLLSNSSSEQHGSGATGYEALPPELESCADTASGQQGRGQQLSPSAGNRAGFMTHAGMLDCCAMSEDRTPPQPVKGTPCSPQQHQLHGLGHPMYPAMQPGAYWAAHTGTKGMVWGMPVLTVACVPGLAVPAKAGKGSAADRCSLDSAVASTVSSPTCQGSTASPAPQLPMPPFMMPPWCWPMLPMMGMFGGMQSGSAAMTGAQMPMYPWVCGMMGSWGSPTMMSPGMSKPGHTAGNTIQGSWPAPMSAAGTVQHKQQAAAGLLPAAGSQPASSLKLNAAGLALGAMTPDAACRRGVVGSGQQGAHSAALDMYRAGSLADSDVAIEDEFIDQLFVEEPKFVPAADAELLSMD